jgi:hypothetical protein
MVKKGSKNTIKIGVGLFDKILYNLLMSRRYRRSFP